MKIEILNIEKAYLIAENDADEAILNDWRIQPFKKKRLVVSKTEDAQIFLLSLKSL